VAADERIDILFTADVAKAIEAIDKLKLKLDELHNKDVTVRVRQSDLSRMDQDARKLEGDLARVGRQADQNAGSFRRWLSGFMGDHQKAFDSASRDVRRYSDQAAQDAQRGFRRMASDAGKAGDDAGKSFWQKFVTAGDKRGGGWPIAAVAGGILAGVPAVNGIGGMAVAGAGALLPGAVGSIALYKLLGDQMKQVSGAANTLETATDKYNAAQQQTVRYLGASSQNMAGYQALLHSVNPAMQQGLEVLTQQNVTWGDLTYTQQQGIIQLRNNAAAYKALTKSQQDQVNALLSEQTAYNGLLPTQIRAADALTRMKATIDSFGTGDSAILNTATVAINTFTDAFKTMEPVIHQAALGWTDLFTKLDSFVKSSTWNTFVQQMAGQTRASIVGFGTAIGNVALGLMRIWQALQPMYGPFIQWMDAITANFAQWATTPKGMKDLQDFMQAVRRDAGPAGQALHELVTLVANLWSAFSNPLPLLMLRDLTMVLNDLANNALGRFLIQGAAWLILLGRLALAMRPVLTAVGGLSKAMGIGTAATTAHAAAERADAVAEASDAAAATSDAAAQARLDAAYAFGGPGTKLKLGVQGMVGGAGGVAMLGVAAAAAAIGLAITQMATDIQKKADAAAGIIRGADGRFTAASSVAGVHVSGAFQNLANRVGASSVQTAQIVDRNGQLTSQRFTVFGQSFSKNNQDIRNVMDAGRTELGQTALLFVAQMHGDVAKMAQNITSSGHTLDQQLQSSLSQVFLAWGQSMPGYWNGLKNANNKAAADAFQKIEATSKSDYQGLQTAMQQYEDDLKHGRQQKAQSDIQTLTQAIEKYMNDSNNGLIDTSNKLNAKLSRDIAQYMQDATNNDRAAALRDLQQMGKDVASQWQTTTNNPVTSSAKAAIVKSGQEIAGQYGNSVQAMQAQADHAVAIGSLQFQNTLAQAQKNISAEIQKTSPTGTVAGSRFASGGPVTGPGTGTSDSIPAWLSHGEFVVNAKAAAKHYALLSHINASGYANGGVAGNFGQGAFNYGLMDDVDYRLFMKAEANQVNSALAAIKTAATAGFAVNLPGTVAQWVAAGLAAAGEPGGWLSDMLVLVSKESGGNPNAVNSTPVGSEHATGLLQMLPSTFRAYMVPGHGNILNPIDNSAASSRYIAARYGSPGNIPGIHGGAYSGYDSGGWMMPGLGGYANGTHRPEAVLTESQWRSIFAMASTQMAGGSGGGGQSIIIKLDGKVLYDSTRDEGYRKQSRNGRSLWNSSLRHA
jgi:hypothetical protein